MTLLYSLLYIMALALLFPFEYRKRPKELRRRWLSEKLGGGGGALPGEAESRLVWVHAVSVGEVIASVPFVKRLKEKYPGLRIVVSTITDTGQKVAADRMGGLAGVVYMPFDLAFCLRRAVRRLRPSLFVVMETELWPNTFRTMKSEGVPVALLNGRISDKSFKGYMKVRVLLKKILEHVDLFCMQEEIYAERVISLGAEKKKVINTGSFKFDIQVKDEVISWADALRGPVVIAGSTHGGEDGIMVAAYKKLKEDFRDLNLIIAPRHPERFGEVEELLRAEGVPYTRRSRVSGSEHVSGIVVLLDTVGELSSVYRVADIAVMGGSFIRHGGQNPLEAAYWGKPVVCGPHMWNFPFISDFYARGAAVETDEKGIYGVLKGLLSSAEKRERMGEKGKEILVRNRGAVDRAVEAVERLSAL